MPLATVRSCALSGVDAPPVLVEVHLGGGLPGMAIVGLPQSAVRESKDRVKAAIRHAGFRFPQVKVVVNLAPADLPKHGGRFDLPIAIGVLLASGQLSEGAAEGLVIVGELGLGGELRRVSGALPAARACRERGEALLLPSDNLAEARRCAEVRVAGAGTLAAACAALADRSSMAFEIGQGHVPDTVDPAGAGGDMADVVGQHGARRALEIAAAGGHNLLFCGPPGTGKSMLASRLAGILPPMSEREASEAAAVASICHAGFDVASWGVRPFRNPHHTVSGVALIGGGFPPMPGEVSLSHHGVLFLDELTEFRRAVLDVLREPMETGRVTVSRANQQADFPARFQLVAAMNPCPCGLQDEDGRECRCTPDQVIRYRARLSAPFLDRIDLHVNVGREPLSGEALAFLAPDEVGSAGAEPSRASPARGGGGHGEDGFGEHDPLVRGENARAEDSATIRARTSAARERQLRRQGGTNATLAPADLGAVCALDADGRALMERVASGRGVSLRVVHRSLRVARTIADLEGARTTGCRHLREALGYRERPVESFTQPDPGGWH